MRKIARGCLGVSAVIAALVTVFGIALVVGASILVARVAEECEDSNSDDDSDEPNLCPMFISLAIVGLLIAIAIAVAGIACLSCSSAWTGELSRRKGIPATALTTTSIPALHSMAPPGSGPDNYRGRKHVEVVVVAASADAQPLGLSVVTNTNSTTKPVMIVKSSPSGRDQHLENGLRPMVQHDIVLQVGDFVLANLSTYTPAQVTPTAFANLLRGIPPGSSIPVPAPNSVPPMIAVVLERSVATDLSLYDEITINRATGSSTIVYGDERALTYVSQAGQEPTSSDRPAIPKPAPQLFLHNVFLPRPIFHPGAHPRLGLGLDLGIAFHIHPMVIEYVAPQSPASGHLFPNDYVLEINGRATSGLLTAQAVLQALILPREHLHFVVVRRTQMHLYPPMTGYDPSDFDNLGQVDIV